MKETVSFQPQNLEGYNLNNSDAKPDTLAKKPGLTSVALTGYSKFKNIMPDAVATEGPRTTATQTAESHAAPNPGAGEIAQPVVSEAQPDILVVGKTLAEKTETSTAEKNPQSPPENKIDINPEGVEKLEKIVGSQKYKEIADRITAQATAEGKRLNPDELSIRVLEEYAQQEMEEATKQTEEQQGEPLSDEQKIAISKTLKGVFKENPDTMSEITKKAVDLAKLQAREIKLNEKQNATEGQKAKASEATVKSKKQNALALQKLNNTLEGKNPQLIKYLQEAPNDPNILELLKKEKRGSLIKTLLKILAILGLSEITSSVEEATSISEH